MQGPWAANWEGWSVGKAKNFHLRIIQALNNPELIFHFKNSEQRYSISFLKRMQFSGGAAFYFCSSVWITDSKPIRTKACGCWSGLRRGWLTGDITFWRSRQASVLADCCQAAVGVAVARSPTCQEKLEVLTCWSHQLIFKCWQIILKHFECPLGQIKHKCWTDSAMGHELTTSSLACPSNCCWHPHFTLVYISKSLQCCF